VARALIARLAIVTASTVDARCDPLFEFFYVQFGLIFHSLSLPFVEVAGLVVTIHQPPVMLRFSVRIRGVVSGLRLAAVRNLVAGVPVALAWNTVDTVGRNALFQFFHVQLDLVFHGFFWLSNSPASALRIDEPAGGDGSSILRHLRIVTTPIPGLHRR